MKIGRFRLLGFVLLITAVSAQAQIRVPVTNNDLRTNLSKVVSDFPDGFPTLKGEVVDDNPQTVEYRSLLDFKSAETNSITRYKSLRPVYSWQAAILSTEDFDEAAKKYKWLCGQLKVMTIKMEGGVSFTLSGNYEEPTETKKFFSSVYKLTPNASSMPKLKIEASMQFEFPEWKVNLLVYEKEKEDKDRGDIMED
jgi:hypothetical protein